jgi:hypothetical protein
MQTNPIDVKVRADGMCVSVSSDGYFLEQKEFLKNCRYRHKRSSGVGETIPTLILKSLSILLLLVVYSSIEIILKEQVRPYIYIYIYILLKESKCRVTGGKSSVLNPPPWPFGHPPYGHDVGSLPPPVWGDPLPCGTTVLRRCSFQHHVVIV